MVKKQLVIILSIILLFSSCNNDPLIVDEPVEKVIKIASVSPLTGSLASYGNAVRNGCEMAINEKVDDFAKLGFQLQFKPMDDKADPTLAMKVAEELANDKEVFGLVGHLTSSATIPASKYYSKYQLALVSPSATVDQITERGLDNTNRIVAKNSTQAKFAADFAINSLKVKTATVICDGDNYGQGIAEAFQTTFQQLGGTVKSFEFVKLKQIDFSNVSKLIKSSNPDIVFYGGYANEAGLLLKELRAAGITSKFMGADGIDSTDMVKFSGENVIGTYYTSVVPDFRLTEKGKPWAEKYKSIYKIDPENYAAYGYDSMTLLLNATIEAIDANNGGFPLRVQVCRTLRLTKNFDGISTKVNFNYSGDNMDASIFMFRFDEQKYPGTLIKRESIADLIKKNLTTTN